MKKTIMVRLMVLLALCLVLYSGGILRDRLLYTSGSVERQSMHWKSNSKLRLTVGVGAVCLATAICWIVMGTLRQKEPRVPDLSMARPPEPNSVPGLGGDGALHRESHNSSVRRWQARPSVAGQAGGKGDSGFERGDPCEILALIQTEWPKQISYSRATEIITKQDAPRLHDMLADNRYAPYWPNIAILIGMVSGDANSVSILVDYFKRPDTADLPPFMVTRKIYSLKYLGKIGGEEARETLKTAVSTAGAKNLAAAWLDSAQVMSEESAILDIQYAAIQGLVLLGEPSVNVFVETLYADEVRKVKENKQFTPFSGLVIDAMATMDYLKDTGSNLDAYLRDMERGHSSWLKTLGPYLDKYDIHGICPTVK